MVFRKVLIANRGEIAVRIIRACREMGITSVAVFSEADRGALHVRLADEAYLLGPAPARESYLSIEKTLEVAQRAGAEAVHPGYGFLAENAEFAEACREAGLVFVGPSPEAIRAMGEKTAARRTMAAAGVPVVPGMMEGLADEAEARGVAAKLGYPVLIKAAGGGGGKGMRLVHGPEEMALAFRAAVSEASSAFGDAIVYLEKLIRPARHIEVQLLADLYGNVVYLGERECSVQRRHQKLLEESPSPALNEDQRRALGEAAVRAARAAEYSNAGTVEFVLDGEGRFYFLEVNTRLQVEHPVTEMVTGLDLVKEQIRLAAGEKLGYGQEDIIPRGAALECRIYAEDPTNTFLPALGTVTALREPAGPGVRVDSSLYEGLEVPVHYDPILAKLITWGRTREEAIGRMRRALAEYRILGVQHTVSFHRFVMDHPAFVAGSYDTGFVAAEWLPQVPAPTGEDTAELASVAALSVGVVNHQRRPELAPASGSREQGDQSRWRLVGRQMGLR